MCLHRFGFIEHVLYVSTRSRCHVLYQLRTLLFFICSGFGWPSKSLASGFPELVGFLWSAYWPQMLPASLFKLAADLLRYVHREMGLSIVSLEDLRHDELYKTRGLTWDTLGASMLCSNLIFRDPYQIIWKWNVSLEIWKSDTIQKCSWLDLRLNDQTALKLFPNHLSNTKNPKGFTQFHHFSILFARCGTHRYPEISWYHLCVYIIITYTYN